MFDELPPTSRCITTTRLASRDFEIGARTLSWRVVNSTSKSNSFQILRALVDEVRAERPTELTDKSNITFTLWRSHRIWASSSAVMKIAQRRDSFALLTQSPLSLPVARALSLPLRPWRFTSPPVDQSELCIPSWRHSVE